VCIEIFTILQSVHIHMTYVTAVTLTQVNSWLPTNLHTCFITPQQLSRNSTRPCSLRITTTPTAVTLCTARDY